MMSAALRNILITLALSDDDVRRFGGIQNDVVGSGADLTGRSETNCGAFQAKFLTHEFPPGISPVE